MTGEKYEKTFKFQEGTRTTRFAGGVLLCPCLSCLFQQSLTPVQLVVQSSFLGFGMEGSAMRYTIEDTTNQSGVSRHL